MSARKRHGGAPGRGPARPVLPPGGYRGGKVPREAPGRAPQQTLREAECRVGPVVARVSGLSKISSSSQFGSSRVTLEFSDGTNLDTATSDVRDALSRVNRNLPDGVEDPTIFKADSDRAPDSDAPGP